MAKTLQFRRGTTSELAEITPANGEILIDTTLNTIKIGNDTVQGGKIITGLSGTSYIYVTGNGASPAENGEELLAAYNLAKTMTPYGYNLAQEYRVQVVVASGRYAVNFAPNGRWDIDTSYVDIVSLSGERDILIEGDINITANDVLIRGLYSTYYIYVDSDLYYLRMENCFAYNLASGDINNNGINLPGTFIDCEAQNNAFGGQPGSAASGTFINCKTYDGFGNYDGNATGVFTNCTTLDRGFAYSDNNIGYGIASGTFTNCTAGWSNSFGGGQGGEASGVFTNCSGYSGSFAGYQSGPGTFSGTITGKLNYCRLADSGAEFAPTSGSGKLHYCIDGNGKEVTSGGGLGGTSYVYVAGDKSSFELNGEELLAAYALAKTTTPFGNAKDVYNRVQVVVAPGTYYFPNDDFNIDTDYVDVVSLTGNRDVLLDFINVTADNVYLKGLDLWTNPFTIYGNQPNLKIENCSGGSYSFSGDSQSTKGTFINCLATYYSFGGRDDVNSIGDGYTQDATFIDCTALNYSFAGADNYYDDTSAEPSSTFVNCKGGDFCFGGIGFAGGTFTNCTAGGHSFGGIGNVTGTFTNCSAGTNSFGGIDDSIVTGTFTNCSAGTDSFGGGTYSIASGTFNNCVAQTGSFGEDGDLTGKAYYCTTTGTFPTVSSGGKTFYCVDSAGPNNQ
jgi:hypothetical protein